MSKSRVIAVSTALAISASALAAPQSFAATVGPKDEEGRCKLTFTEAEHNAILQTAKNYTPALIDAVINGYDAAFKGSKKVIADFRREAAVKQYAQESPTKAGPSQETFNTLNALMGPYAEKLKATGMSADAAKFYLFKIADYAAVLATDYVGTLDDVKIVGDANPRPVSPTNYSFHVQTDVLTDAQKKTIVDSMKADRALQKFEEHERRKADADREAQKACAAGGNKEVKFDTEIITKGGSSVGGEGGELSPGAIAGIVIGVLAVLGVAAVAAAPMLGIKLPAMPKLPF